MYWGAHALHFTYLPRGFGSYRLGFCGLNCNINMLCMYLTCGFNSTHNTLCTQNQLNPVYPL